MKIHSLKYTSAIFLVLIAITVAVICKNKITDKFCVVLRSIECSIDLNIVLLNIFCFSLAHPYIISPSGGQCSDAGYQDVTSIQECGVAVSKLNKIFLNLTENNHYFPKYCYIYGCCSIYFNKHTTGSAHEKARPICKSFGMFLR